MNTTYIAFLRAINVGGRVVKMERLRELFTELGFLNVRSYIQTGNVFFESSSSDRERLTNIIEAHLLKSLGYEVTTCLRTVRELEESLRNNPFDSVTITPDTRLCVVFLSKPLPKIDLPLVSAKGDFELLKATPGEAFVILRQVDQRPGNPVALLEKTYGIRATARFFHTTQKILEAAKNV